MSDPAGNDDQDDLLERALAGDESALAALFDGYRDRLRRMIRLRLDRRLAGRVDSSDVLQEAYLDVRKRIAEYARDPAAMPFHLWLRLVDRPEADRHPSLPPGRPDARRRPGGFAPSRAVSPGELGLAGRPAPRQNDQCQQGRDPAEHKLIVQEALNGMDPIDREVLALRHFEHLSNDETAQVLGLTKSAASNRYVRALKRLKEILSSIPGLKERL